ncbi:hypothetical protein LCGC14_0739530 [marine sediment metagenome]|uniref:Uncharacterized protein n=1 Tax=marine sediment metagenome TaxID=412755 RepID=A0A0F9SS36_9ZZZZ
MEYSIKTHVANLSEMLDMLKSPEGNRRTINACCPAAQGFHYHLAYHRHDPWENNETCKICMQFVGIDLHKHGKFYCPCWEFSNKKALAKTREALKEYYKGRLK